MQVADIARICHEANRAYCVTLGDFSQPSWDNAPEWQKQSAIQGVLFHLAHPESTPEMSHESWLRHKLDEGWTYGPVKDVDAKLHPCCVPFDRLPVELQIKDHIFVAIVHALASGAEDVAPE